MKEMVEIKVKLSKSLIKRIIKVCMELDISMDKFFKKALTAYIIKHKIGEKNEKTTI